MGDKRELVSVKVKPVKKEKEEELKPIEELPDDGKPKEIPNRWRVKGG